MILIYIAILFILGGLALFKYGGWDAEPFGFLSVIIGAFLVGAVIIGAPVNRMAAMAEIQRIEAIAATADSARQAGDALEGAAYRMKIADANAWIAEAQYWRGTTFWVFWPAEVETLEAVR